MDPWFFQARRFFARLGAQGRAESTLDRIVHGAPEGGRCDLDTAFALVLLLGRGLLSLGLAAHRLEEALERIAGALGYEVDCFATPTALIVTLSERTPSEGRAELLTGPEDARRRRTRLVRVEPGETDLERLSALSAIVGRVERGELTASDARARVEAVLARPPRYRAPLVVLAYGLASASAALLLGGGGGDVLPALGLGATVGVMEQGAQRVPTLGRILPALAAVTTTLLARGATLAGLAVHESILVLASVIVVLPGFTLTTATTELATANIVSGTSRLMGAMTTLLQLGFGVALAHRIAILFPGPAAAPPIDQPLWWGLAASAFAALAFAVLLRAAPRDVPVILLGAAVAVAGARLGRAWLGPELGAFVGSFLLGVAAHLHARFRDRPVLLVLAPGSLLMVPGSLGFLSVSSMLDADVVLALQTGFRMLLIAMSLAAGILLATVAIPPRRAL